jgi:hypothetical protein
MNDVKREQLPDKQPSVETALKKVLEDSERAALSKYRAESQERGHWRIVKK